MFETGTTCGINFLATPTSGSVQFQKYSLTVNSANAELFSLLANILNPSFATKENSDKKEAPA